MYKVSPRAKLLFYGVLSILIYACTPSDNSETELLGAAAPAAQPFSLDFSEFAPPATTGLPDSVTDANQYAWDIFAWQTFIAMNWPAVEPSASNGYLRGFPDSTKTFIDAGNYPNTPLVWETFKEKREMFKHDAKTMADAKPNPWSSDFSYDGVSPLGAHSKRVFATSKFSTLDETVQVQAEARESYYDTTSHKSGITAARVFRGTTPDLGESGPGNAVRYEVKVNYDFFKYVVDEGFYFDPMTFARTKSIPPVQLPWRTSLASISGISSDAQKTYKDDYTIAAAHKGYYNGRKGNNGATPPRIGSIHIKAAWAPIQDSEKSRFIAREAEYYAGMDKTPETALFGLVGLHIIQRIKVGSGSDPGGLGGTFIFSTWEHKDIRENQTNTTYNGSDSTTQYTYANYFLNPSTAITSEADPAISSPFFVSRLYPILPHTQAANDSVTKWVGESSVWSNYRLVGTQYKPVDIKTDSKVTGGGMSVSDPFVPDDAAKNNQKYEPVFLANLVIETNVGLQQFQGTPPLLNPVPEYTGVKNIATSDNFMRLGKNISFQRTANNMGGCMGCHGVAQLNGYSFSFVLLGGQKGADPDSERYFVDPIGQRNRNNDAIEILESGVPLSGGVQNSSAMLYLTNDNGNATGTSSSSTIVVTNIHQDKEGLSFKFGNTVTIMDQSTGLYLTASATDGNVSFDAKNGTASEWVLYNPVVPNSDQFILRTDNIGFKNSQYNGYLSLTTGDSQIKTTSTPSANTAWDLFKFMQ